MCLIHDIVEIDAGDTYAYDEEALKTQKAREDAAKERIFSILPKAQAEELLNIFNEFEENTTPEARFVHTIDNLQPIILNNSNNGNDWREHGVKKSQVLKRQELSKPGSDILYNYICELINKNTELGNLKDE